MQTKYRESKLQHQADEVPLNSMDNEPRMGPVMIKKAPSMRGANNVESTVVDLEGGQKPSHRPVHTFGK